MKEAKSNIEYLQIYEKPCEELSLIIDPVDIPPKIPHILNLFRYIWLKSPYYKTNEKLVLLCRALSNQIIISCTDYIDLSVVFKEKKTREATKTFQTCIDCLTEYIKIYMLISEAHTELGPKPWNLDRSLIFNHIDSFIQRCKDMIELCEAMVIFGRYDECQSIPKPKFGGNRGKEFESFCDKIESMFNESLDDVANISHMVLDVQNSHWYDEILKFRNRMKDIEVVIENLVNAVFDQISTLDDGVEALGALYNYAQKESLKTLFDRKTHEVCITFIRIDFFMNLIAGRTFI